MKAYLTLALVFLAALVYADPHAKGWRSDPHHKDKLTQFVHHPAYSTANIPDVIDLSGTMPDGPSAPLAIHMDSVYDQGQEGSCTANAGDGAFEFIYHLTNGHFYGGSRQGLYACELMHDGNWPNDSGSYTATVVWVLMNQGLGQEKCYPYSTRLGTPLPKCYLDGAAKNKIAHAYDVDNGDHVSIRVALAKGFPVMFGGYVYESIETLTGSNYFNAPHKGRPIGGHERLIVGFNTKLKHKYANGKTVTGFYWVRNSWSPRWGWKGYCWEPMSELEDRHINEDCAVIDSLALTSATQQ